MPLHNVNFVRSAPDKSQWIQDDKKEIVILGRSNVGKSTFINRLANQKQLARASSTPGRTRLLNFFDVNQEYRLVDAPGYGYAGVKKTQGFAFGKMMEEYFTQRNNLVGAVLLLDSRRVPNSDDVMLFRYLVTKNIPFILVATKYDKLNQSQKALLRRNLMQTLNLPMDTPLILSSIDTSQWIDEVAQAFNDLITKQSS